MRKKVVASAFAIVFVFLIILFYLANLPATGPYSGIFYVGGSKDDARERGDETWFSYESETIGINSIIDVPEVELFCGGIRFPNVTIPKDATIYTASLSVYLYNEDTDDFDCAIYGNNVDDAQNFEDNQHILDMGNRSRTSVLVSWVVDAVGTGWVEKAGLESIIQEIVNRDGWSSGNAIVLLLVANNDSLRQKHAYFYAFDKDPQYAPKLSVTWSLE